MSVYGPLFVGTTRVVYKRALITHIRPTLPLSPNQRYFKKYGRTGITKFLLACNESIIPKGRGCLWVDTHLKLQQRHKKKRLFGNIVLGMMIV